MEHKKEVDAFKQHVEKITTPIFNKVLHEVNSNSMTTTKTKNFLWRPHNYRLLLPVKQLFSQPIAPLKALLYLQKSNYKPKFTEHTKKVSLKNFENTTVELNKNNIVVIWSSKNWYLLNDNEAIENKVKQILDICLRSARKFSKITKIKLKEDKHKWIRTENTIKGEEFLDKIPRDLIINNTTFKKVYTDQVEFKDPLYLKNYINNRALESFVPDLVQTMGKLNQSIQKEIYNKKLHLAVLNDMRITLKQIRGDLKQSKVISLDDLMLKYIK